MCSGTLTNSDPDMTTALGAVATSAAAISGTLPTASVVAMPQLGMGGGANNMAALGPTHSSSKSDVQRRRRHNETL